MRGCISTSPPHSPPTPPPSPRPQTTPFFAVFSLCARFASVRQGHLSRTRMTMCMWIWSLDIRCRQRQGCHSSCINPWRRWTDWFYRLSESAQVHVSVGHLARLIHNPLPPRLSLSLSLSLSLTNLSFSPCSLSIVKKSLAPETLLYPALVIDRQRGGLPCLWSKADYSSCNFFLLLLLIFYYRCTMMPALAAHWRGTIRNRRQKKEPKWEMVRGKMVGSDHSPLMPLKNELNWYSHRSALMTSFN